MKYHLEETESDDLRRKMERERELCGTKLQCLETPGKRLCVCFQLCVCVCARVCSILMCRAERRMREEERKRKCVARGSVSPSILLCSWREDTACYFFKFFIKLWTRLTSSCKPRGEVEFPVCMCVYNMRACVPALTGCEIICWKDIYKHISVLKETIFRHRLAEGVVV